MLILINNDRLGELWSADDDVIASVFLFVGCVGTSRSRGVAGRQLRAAGQRRVSVRNYRAVAIV